MIEKLGRNDPCPCGSGRRFQELLHARWPLRRVGSQSLLQTVRTSNGLGPVA
ncbi:MAG: SEC-C metal-binding domain-containing protein [Sulfurifustis sp.]